MSRDDIINFWGRNNLILWSRDALKEISIPESSKTFLMEVGMPRQEKWTLNFDSESRNLPPVGYRSNCRRIGFDDVVPICLDEASQGRVIAAEQALGGTDRYINSSVETFGEFLVYYQQYRNHVSEVSEKQIPQFIDATEKKMRSVDASAFSDPNNYWPVIIEQMRQGLL